MAAKISVKISVALTFVLSVQVSCWTVDLAAMNELNLETEVSDQNSENVGSDLEDVYQSSELEYQSYMEKRIHGALNNGSIYLDGLRQAMAHYRERLDNCTNVPTTTQSTTWLPENDPTVPSEPDLCRSIMAASDQVTKLSELALWATNELRERKFADKDTAQQEEEELLMKLAWFLDQLAQLTGYLPDPSEYQHNATESSTMQMEEISTTTIPETTISLEIMQSVENGPPLPKRAPKLTNNIKKRSVDNEMTNFAKNYIKYKVWNTDNSDINIKSDSYEVKNEINTKSRQKRGIFAKKSIQLRPPTKKRNFKAKKIYVEKPKRHFFQKQHGGMAVKIIRKAVKPKLAKRSVYYKDYGVSRIPEDPMQDISYYVKNKPGTMYSPSVVQVANVYDSLMKHYNLATFEMIKRFGSNITLGMDNLTNGAVKSMADAQ
ncbi:unnamed protein product [Pieris brassicae]|uniref:Uncharacterized protein n=1 Tax=Pieris brassicae TaxID=7116 RepID=A0A9P0TSM2_PIEBR|nr:unnamed protein product [Pieris brassicae]